MPQVVLQDPPMIDAWSVAVSLLPLLLLRFISFPWLPSFAILLALGRAVQAVQSGLELGRIFAFAAGLLERPLGTTVDTTVDSPRQPLCDEGVASAGDGHFGLRLSIRGQNWRCKQSLFPEQPTFRAPRQDQPDTA